MIRSITGRWETPEEKCWAMFYWNHIARRQTSPDDLHGMALRRSDPPVQRLRLHHVQHHRGHQLRDLGRDGLRAKYWDISLHTVSEVEYGGRWHMYDNSMSALYTLCDGKTIAGVEDIGKAGRVRGVGRRGAGPHRPLSLPNGQQRHGFLTGADSIRSLTRSPTASTPTG